MLEGLRAQKARAVKVSLRERGVHRDDITPHELRILYLKKRHRMAKLMRKHPEIDWYGPDRAKKAAATFSAMNRARRRKASGV